MDAECAVSSCKNSPQGQHFRPLTYFRFPRSTRLARCWCSFVGVPGFRSNGNSIMCSDHFADSCWVDASTKTVLRPSSVPTIKTAGPPEQSGSAGPSGTGDRWRKRCHYQAQDYKHRAKKPRKLFIPAGDDDADGNAPGTLRGDSPFSEEMSYRHGVLVVRKLEKLPQSKGLHLQTAYNRSLRKRIGFGMIHTIDHMFQDKLHP